MCEQSPELFNPPTLSAQELHELLLKLRAAGNTTHRRFIDALRAMEESKLYLQLGHPSLVAYADATFHYGRSQTYELVRVSKALGDLPRIAQAFERGELPFSLVARLTRVATGETESLWIEHCGKHPRAAVDLEIRDAERKGRKHPRKDGYGLPGLPVKVCFELSPEEHAVVSEALKKVSREMGEGLDRAQPEPKAALLYLCRRILETDPAQGVTDGRVENGSSPYTVVMHRCPDCQAAAVEKDAGRIEVSKDAADRICTESEERDRRSSPKLRREVFLRDGNRCANPFCRKDLTGAGHAHHITFWSKGGRTELSNLIAACVLCRIRHKLHYAESRIMPNWRSTTRWA